MTAGGSRRYTWRMKKNQRYPTDLTDRQWNCIKELIPPAKPGGRPRSLEMRAVINAIVYIVVSGCQWRMLPREYPAWQSVYTYFQQWRDDGTWQRLHNTLRAQVREHAGRHKHPTAGALDRKTRQDHTDSRRARVRCGQEGQWAQAPSAGGYAGFAAGSRGHLGCHFRPCRSPALASTVRRSL